MIIYTSQEVLFPTPKYGSFPAGTKSVLITNFASLYVTFTTSNIDITLPPVTALVTPVIDTESWAITARTQTGVTNPSSEQYVSITFQPFAAAIGLRSIHVLPPLQGQAVSKGTSFYSQVFSTVANTPFGGLTMGSQGILYFSFVLGQNNDVMTLLINNRSGTFLNGATIATNTWQSGSTPLNEGDLFQFQTGTNNIVYAVTNARYFA